jgi:hypothetical protein
MLGVQISGLPAWLMWRAIYLAKLPSFEKKLRVALEWILDLFFPRNFVQILTLQGFDQIARRLAFIRQQPSTPVPGKSDAISISRPAENSQIIQDGEGLNNQRSNGKPGIKSERSI